MSAKRIAALIVAALLFATLLVSGCVKPTVAPVSSTPKTTVPSSSAVEPSQSSVEPSTTTPIDATGPITTPASGSAERKALLDAAREKLGTSTQFYVNQLYAQGDTALGDLEPLDANSTGRIFVAWQKRDGVWTAIGVTKYGSASASAASTARALPSFSEAIINKIDWKLAKPKTNGTGSASSMKASLTAAAKKWSDSAMEGKGTPYEIDSIKVAQDSKGNWWGHVVVQPTGDSNNSYESLNIWAKYTGGKWNGKIQDPEPPAASSYFPSSVISKLGL